MIPEFDTALSDFCRMLQRSGFSSDILWVWRADVTSHRAHMWIRLPLPEENTDYAKQRYALGREMGWGVCLHCFALVDGRPCCYVWFAESEEDAADRFCVGLTLKHAVPPWPAQAVRNRLYWRCLSWFNRLVGWTGLAESVPEVPIDPARFP